MSSVLICEACRERSVAEVIDEYDPDEPYRVCGECGRRLRQWALRPLEWFDLAAKYGWGKYPLHDDFYDDDVVALQPDTDDCSANGTLAPTLDEAARSLDRLVDYCMTRGQLGAPEYDAFRTFPAEAILGELKRRAATGNRQILQVTLTLCANALNPSPHLCARPFTRACNDNELSSWAEAAARCLPHPEGLHNTIDALQAYSGRELRECKDALLWFRSVAVLDWIEVHAQSANITADWGQLAALSDLSWSRVEAWLSRGRPLSLIALDALKEFIQRPGQALIVKRLEPKLKGCPDRLTLARALQAYIAADTAPRASSTCRYLTEHIGELRVE